MTFEHAKNYLYSLSNLPRAEYMKDPKHCERYLKRLQFFLDILGNPEKKIPHYIHVSGTSGKGSVCNFLHAILNKSGKRVGSTISPHPTDILDRWRIGNQKMKKKEFIKIIEHFKPKLDEYIRTTPYGMLSYFDITTAITFFWFKKQCVDFAILEAGCGGRYDSTNVIRTKDIAVITNIELDHTHILGNTKKKIAYEKAGIVTPRCHVFTGERDKNVLEVIKQECVKKKVPLFHSSTPPFIIENNIKGSSFKYTNQIYTVSALGAHQIKNAVIAIDVSRALNINEAHIKAGLKKAKQPLCMEIISKNPTTILDGAHNPHKMKASVQTLKMLEKHINGGRGNIHMIVGFSENKNVKKMLTQLTAFKPKTITATRNTTNPFRKVKDPKDIKKQCEALAPQTNIQIFLDPMDAFMYTKTQTKKHDILFITGSIFLSGEVKKFINKTSTI